MGTQHQPARPGARIVSLVPSLTELLFDLGLGSQIVGRTGFCIHPKPAVEAIPSIGGTKKVNFGKLRKLEPDYVLLNIDENPKAMAERLAELKIPAIVTHPVRVTDNLDLYDLLGGIFGRGDAAAALKSRLRNALQALRDPAVHRPPHQILYLIWRDPWMTVSSETYIADAFRLINWQVVPCAGGSRYPTFSFTQSLLSRVDLVLFSSEPYAFDVTHLDSFASAFPDHGHKAHLIDGEMMSWYGSRAIKGLAYLDAFARSVCR